MRRPVSLTLPVLLLVALTGCTFTRRESPVIVVSATPALLLAAPSPSAAPTDTAAPAILPTATPLPPSPTLTAEPPTAAPTDLPRPTSAPPPTLVPALPTRTPSGPPTVLPLDDGSGNFVPDTGDALAMRPVSGVTALPESLYYLSDQAQAGTPQVWRLRYGVTLPDQQTFSPSGVTAFDVAPNGTLAYIAGDGTLLVGGVPVLPSIPAGEPLPQATALAWSPRGDWLAYTLLTPGAESLGSGSSSVDGLWVRSASGPAFLLAPNRYTGDDTRRVYDGPLDWRPDGVEVLVGHERLDGRSFSRVTIGTSQITPLWNTTSLPADRYALARWSINGNAIIVSGAGQVLRVEPDTLGVQVLLGAEAALWPEDAQQFADGTVTFVAASGPSADAGRRRLYLIRPGETLPSPVTSDLAQTGRVDFLWDNYGQEVLLVVYSGAEASLGTAYLRDASGTLHDLTPLLGLAGRPRWGVLFRAGEAARVQTTSGDSLNIRTEPGGKVLIALANGARITIMGGPRWVDGSRWWWIKTPDGVTGWAVESVLDARGLRLRTLLPVG